MAQAKPKLKETLEAAIDEMVTKGILWPEALAQFEKLFLSRVLRESNGNLCRASELMGLHRNTLSKKLRDHKLEKGARKK
ncbi:MAG: histidine kinase [Acidobacteria bacterium]|nr:histidine kinase [Acidobacteriota bacterium]